MSAGAGALVAAVVAWACGALVRSVAAGLVLDHPGMRSSHTTPRTRLGGLAIICGLTAGVLAAGAWRGSMRGVVVAAAVVGALGLAEDVRRVPIRWRLVGQALAGVVIAQLVLYDPPLWAWLLAVGWVIAFTNVFNFMDGVDGLAGAHLAVAGLTWLVVGAVEDIAALRVLGATAAGCAAGFLPHNAPRAHVFMGDLGAYAAGAWLAGSAVVALELGAAPVAILAPLGLFLFDTSWTLLARARRGENLLRAHRSHLYQRLVQSGWTHARTTGFATTMSAAVAAAGLLALAGRAVLTGIAIGLGLSTLAAYALTVTSVARSVPSTADNEP